MTVSNQLRSIRYLGDSSATEFDFTFPIKETSHLTVLLYQVSTQAYTTLSPTAYSVTGISETSTGGTVTYPLSNLPITSDYQLVILRTLPYTQNTSIRNQGGFYPEILEDSFDDLTFMVQQLADDVGRALKVPYGQTGPLLLADTAGSTLTVDSSGNVVDGTPTAVGVATTWAAGFVAAADTAKEAAELIGYGDPNGPRNPVVYYNGNTVAFSASDYITMGGHRNNGRFKRGLGKIFPQPAPTYGGHHLVTWGNGVTQGALAFESKSTQYTWYAAFWCANEGDAVAQIKVVPFLRVKSVAGNVVTLGSTKENELPSVTKYHVETGPVNVNGHFFTADNMVGSEVLVLHEYLSNRTKSFSGRLTTVTANTTTTVTLANAGTMEEGDWFLPAPIYDHYSYIGCWYCESGVVPSAELRNIADTGTIVHSRGAGSTQIYDYTFSRPAYIGAAGLNGAMPANGVSVYWDTLISPMARAVCFRQTDTWPTPTLGYSEILWGIDYAHDVWRLLYYKDVGTNPWYTSITLPLISFSFSPMLNFQDAVTTIGGTPTRATIVHGWLEP